VNRFALGVGSNLGDRLANLRLAHLSLESLGEIRAVSGLYETAPLGGPEQQAYLNAVIVLETGLGPADLLARCQAIEMAAGRERVERWGPRTLDIDIISVDGPAVDSDHLRVPHPRASDREFVLRPLVEVWPDALVQEEVTAGEALARLESQGVDRLAGKWTSDTNLGTWLVVAQMLLIAAIGLGIASDGSVDFSSLPLFRVLGLVMVLSGLALAWAAGRALGPALVANPEPRPGAGMVESGPYRLVRHPIYGSVLLLITGAAVALASRLGLLGVLPLLAFFLAKASYEERRLRIRYPGYVEYRGRVRHRLIPGVL
jgi:2-amino-4-hydroxy-6-hydroxymethyldihydropteridine diphosphokinase